MKAKKLFYSFITSLLSAIMLFGTFSCGSGDKPSGGNTPNDPSGGTTNQPSEKPEEKPEDEYFLQRGEDEKQLTIYYQRSAGYENCDVWMWHAEANGRGYELHSCAYGAKVVLNVPNTIDEVGFIIRTGCSDPGGETWGTATKDGTDADRSVALKEDETVIYTKAGDPKSYTSTDGGKTLKEIKYISLADMQDATHVKFVLSSALKFDALSDYKLLDGEGNEVEIASVTTLGKQSSNGVLTTKEPLDLSKAYTLQMTDLDPVAVVPNTYFSSTEFKENYIYEGDDLGVTLTGDSTTFKLWAPTASKVTLNLFESGDKGEAYQREELVKGDKGVWSYAAKENLSGKYYTYNVVTSMGDQEAVDPYAVSAGLNGNRGMILDMATTNPQGWTGETYDNPAVTNYTDAVIWEIHVRDFSNMNSASQYKGKYLAFTETFARWRRLFEGVGHHARTPVALLRLRDGGRSEPRQRL